MKKIAVVFTLCLTILSSVIPVHATEMTQVNTVNQETITNPNINSRIVHSYTKTVTKTYVSYPVPSSISYSEFQMNAWFSGTLYLKSLSNSGGYWVAVYSGTLTGII